MAHRALQLTEFDSTHLSATDSFDLWREVLRGTYTLSASMPQAPSLRISTGLWEADRLVIGYCNSEAGRVDRGRAQLGHSGRFLKLRLFTQGQVRLLHGGNTTVIGPGAVHVIDQSREITEISSPHKQFSVFLPHVVVGFDPGRHPIWKSISLDSPVGRILGDAMMLFLKELPAGKGDEIATLEAGFIGLVRGLFSGALGSDDAEGVATARAEAMKNYLDHRLQNPDLGLESLLAAFGAARSTIYRDFHQYGGVNRYIAKRRLERAFAELASKQGHRGIVQEVSNSWCFESVSHFTRQFRYMYGMTPGSAVGLNARLFQSIPANSGAEETRFPAVADPQALSRVYQRIAGAWG